MFPLPNSPVFPTSAFLTLSSILLSGVIVLPLFAETDPPSGDGTRPAVSASAPYIISPRNSLTRNQSPRFQWARVENLESSYIVSLASVDRGTFWQKEVMGIETIYDGEPLDPGTKYTLSVTARSNSVNRSDNTQISIFYVISEEERAEVEAELRRIEASTDPSDRRVFLGSQVELLLDHYLTGDAIDFLDAELVKNPNSRDAVCLLDDLFEQANDAMLDAIGVQATLARYLEDRNLENCDTYQSPTNTNGDQ